MDIIKIILSVVGIVICVGLYAYIWRAINRYCSAHHEGFEPLNKASVIATAIAFGAIWIGCHFINTAEINLSPQDSLENAVNNLSGFHYTDVNYSQHLTLTKALASNEGFNGYVLVVLGAVIFFATCIIIFMQSPIVPALLSVIFLSIAGAVSVLVVIILFFIYIVMALGRGRRRVYYEEY